MCASLAVAEKPIFPANRNVMSRIPSKTRIFKKNLNHALTAKVKTSLRTGSNVGSSVFFATIAVGLLLLQQAR